MKQNRLRNLSKDLKYNTKSVRRNIVDWKSLIPFIPFVVASDSVIYTVALNQVRLNFLLASISAWALKDIRRRNLILDFFKTPLGATDNRRLTELRYWPRFLIVVVSYGLFFSLLNLCESKCSVWSCNKYHFPMAFSCIRSSGFFLGSIVVVVYT